MAPGILPQDYNLQHFKLHTCLCIFIDNWPQILSQTQSMNIINRFKRVPHIVFIVNGGRVNGVITSQNKSSGFSLTAC